MYVGTSHIVKKYLVLILFSSIVPFSMFERVSIVFEFVSVSFGVPSTFSYPLLLLFIIFSFDRFISLVFLASSEPFISIASFPVFKCVSLKLNLVSVSFDVSTAFLYLLSLL